MRQDARLCTDVIKLHAHQNIDGSSSGSNCTCVGNPIVYGSHFLQRQKAEAAETQSSKLAGQLQKEQADQCQIVCEAERAPRNTLLMYLPR